MGFGAVGVGEEFVHCPLVDGVGDGGFDGRDRVIAQRAVIGFLLGFLQNEHHASIRGPGTAAMADLPEQQFPLLARTARLARTMSVDEEFAGGVAIVLRGLRP